MFLFIFCNISLIIYIFLKYEKKVCSLKNQISLLNIQTKNLRYNILKLKEKNKNLIIYFYPSKYSIGIINYNTYIYISPIDNSPILNTIKENTKVTLLCIAKTEDKLWYEITFINDTNLNCRGWVIENSINKIDI